MKLNFPIVLTSFLALIFFTTNCKNKPHQHSGFYDSTEWKVVGPGGGGGVFSPTISPFNDDFVITHCDMTGIYISCDGGKNWSMKNLWNVPVDFEFDPTDQNTLYVATRGFRYSEDRGSGLSLLYRSSNKGESWEIIYPDVGKAKEGLERLQSYDYLPSDIIDNAINGTIDKVVVDPSDNNRIYLGLAPLEVYISQSNSSQNRDSTFIVISDNRGESWELLSTLPGKRIKAIFPIRKREMKDMILVFTNNGGFHVNKITGEVKQLKLPIDNLIIVEGGKGKEGSLIYIQSAFINENGKFSGGMFISSDQGDTWEQINTGITKSIADGTVPIFREGLAVCETQPKIAYISFTSSEKNRNGEIEQIYNIYKTINSGKEWEPVLKASTSGGYITNNFEGSWMEESFDPGWGGAALNLGVAPKNPDICFAGDNGRAYKTIDGGKNWKQTYSHNQPDGSYSSGGLNVTTCYGVHFDPFDSEHYFICYTDIGLFHTYNRGESWFHSLTNIPHSWQNTCYDLKFDPEIKDKVWSVWGNAHDLPREKMFSLRGFDHYSGGIALSIDGGKTWSKSNNGMPENSVCTSILIDPSTPANKRTLYVTVFDKGVYKSINDGQNWIEVNNGLKDNLYAWQIRRNTNGILYLLCCRGKSRGEQIDGVLYYSEDDAATWKSLALPEGVNGPHDLLIDQNNEQIMYLSCWPRKTTNGDKNGGIYKTIDGGLNWYQIFDERVRVNSAATGYENSDIIFINTFQDAAYRSDDAGENWLRLNGYRFKWGQKPIPDPNNSRMLFLTTFGGSVFYGPAEGTENTFEGIVNMPEDWW
ncbi:Hypothetical protein PSM36_3041 [Proteiniphilum saccharofermentans]|uniref:Sortilin N-terminal domain-containing protein n=1 Tax=Proteiniphilum saccharofermentans TaxID=1642647 RepID=A0A1R3T3Q4_9BACT|nr:hypothetical protein [Proteiniphilum saccharofermentans]SCD21830.1 Hypothetical protein PSM36_3041 [Proteiniphilum saccharofermentans]